LPEEFKVYITNKVFCGLKIEIDHEINGFTNEILINADICLKRINKLENIKNLSQLRDFLDVFDDTVCIENVNNNI
jgi:hypothetical protein